MARKRHPAEQIIAKLREAEVVLAKGAKMPQQALRSVTQNLCQHLAARGWNRHPLLGNGGRHDLGGVTLIHRRTSLSIVGGS